MRAGHLRRTRAANAVESPTYNPGQTPGDLSGALGGLKPGTGRSLNALIKLRAETGVERLGDNSPLFKPGQVLDEVRAADGSAVSIAFAFPEAWVLAGGPNLDVREIKESDSAFLLVTPLPASARDPSEAFKALPADFFLNVLFDPKGKYGAYGTVDERKVISSRVEELTLPSGGKQLYRRLILSFAPLTYNANTVERRALISATTAGGSVFIFVAGCKSTRYKKIQSQLEDTQLSFRAVRAPSRVRPPAST